jgi:hypothetical protein
MKTYIKKGFLYLALGFVVIFCLRLGYGYFVPTEPFSPTSNQGYVDRFINSELSKKNHATDKMNAKSSWENTMSRTNSARSSMRSTNNDPRKRRSPFSIASGWLWSGPSNITCCL